MNTFHSIYLGVVQGLTEFLPISSSGHLVLFQNLLGLHRPQLLLDCALHFGTLLAVCFYYRADLKDMMRDSWHLIRDRLTRERPSPVTPRASGASLSLEVVLGTIPTALIGLFFRSSLENFFGSVNAVGVALLFTGTILAITKFISKDYNHREQVGILTALAVGTVQGIALVPGISRSGITIVCGILLKLRGDQAARFSFLLSIPAIMGALSLQLYVEGLKGIDLIPLSWGVVSSCLLGLMALKILTSMIRRRRLFFFAPYCWALGLLIILTGSGA
jgi:undecaprenyl-diphosphatase